MAETYAIIDFALIACTVGYALPVPDARLCLYQMLCNADTVACEAS